MSAVGDRRQIDSDHEDFVLDFGAPEGGRRSIRVLESPAGQARGAFASPLTRGEVRHFFDDLDTGGRALGLGPLAPSPRRPTSTRIGGELFDATFHGEVRESFLRSLEHVRMRRRGLRLKIRTDPGDPDLVLVQSLPWELLYRADTRQFLARHRRTPVVRYLDLPEPADLAPVPRPLRILSVMAAPHGLPPLDLENERASIEKEWREHEAVEVDVVPPDRHSRATLDALRHALLDKTYHVVHFMGHGDFDPATGKGVVFFEDDDGSADAVDGESLADALRDFDALRLVTVNACRGAEAGDEAGRRPFAGVATALLRGGVPAVVGMQAPISDRAAVAFSRELYHRLAAGDPVDAAVTEGRRAIGRPGRTDEWAKPVLFLRSRGARLWQPGGLPPPARPADWSWHPAGLVLLAAGAVGAALLAGLGALALWDEPALRGTMTLTLTVLAVLAFLLIGRDPRRGRRASHLAVRRKAFGAGLGGLGVAAAAAWTLAGPGLVCASRCGALGCAPDGVRRILIGAFENRLPDTVAPGLAWAGDTADFLAMKLEQVPGLQLLDLRSELDDGRARRCADFAIRGSVGQLGPDVVVKAQLSRRGGAHLGEVEVEAAPDPTGETIIMLNNRLTLEILDALGLEPDEGLIRRIRHTPTSDPHALMQNVRGVASFEQGDFFLAALHFETARELDPSYADAANNLGLVRLEQGERETAIGLFREAASLLPRHPSFHYNLGLALDLDGRPEAAVAALRKTLELDPLHAPAYNNLGYALLELGEIEEAARSLKRGLAEARDEEDRASLYKNLGRVAFEQGAFATSVGHFDEALKRLDPFPEALYYRALALERLERSAEACRDWKAYEAVLEHDDDQGRRRDRHRCEERPS